MMIKPLALIVLIAAQLAVPSWMIVSQENILREGAVYKFKTAPVDPYDIFRGRYVALSTDQRSVKMDGVKNIERGQKLYVLLANDQDGFARVTDAQLERPQGNDYIKTKVTYQSGNKVNFNLPINRYYMNEEKAPQAEALYREHSRVNKQDAYVVVRVLNGQALIEGLYVGGKPIESYLEVKK